MTRRDDDCPIQLTARPVLSIILTLGLLCALPFPAEAKTFKLGGDPPALAVTIPPDWETVSADTGVEATVPGVYFSAELIDTDDLQQANEASAQFLIDRKIKLKPETKVQKIVKIAGLSTVQNDWEATDPDGPTRVRISVVTISKEKVLLVFYWRVEAGEKAHGGEVEYIMNSLKPTK